MIQGFASHSANPQVVVIAPGPPSKNNERMLYRHPTLSNMIRRRFFERHVQQREESGAAS